MTPKLVCTALVAAALGSFGTMTVRSSEAAPIVPSDTPLPLPTAPKPLPKPSSKTEDVDGKFSAVVIAKDGAIESFAVDRGNGNVVSYKGCGARAADHAILVGAGRGDYSFARVFVVDGCLAKYTVWR